MAQHILNRPDVVADWLIQVFFISLRNRARARTDLRRAAAFVPSVLAQPRSTATRHILPALELPYYFREDVAKGLRHWQDWQEAAERLEELREMVADANEPELLEFRE